MDKQLNSGFFRALVEVYHGNREMCNIIAAADIGTSGVGIREVLTINYEQGKQVDKSQVLEQMSLMKKASDAEKTPFKILSYRVLSLIFIGSDQKV